MYLVLFYPFGSDTLNTYFLPRLFLLHVDGWIRRQPINIIEQYIVQFPRFYWLGLQGDPLDKPKSTSGYS